MRILLVVAAGVNAIALAAAQTSNTPSPRTETKHLTLKTSTSVASAAAGTRVSLFVDISPKAEMHVYAPEEKNLRPISLTIHSKAELFTAHAPKFPKSERFVIESLNETQFGYSKPFRIVQDVTLRNRPAGSAIEITGTLEYQACDKSICYIPAKVPVAWTMAVK
jgi:DsbC/DsbD-like thiol-disulfide interchange protein